MAVKLLNCERLTIKNADGTATLNKNFAISDAINRLAAYEDIGYTPEEICELKKHKHGLTHTRMYSIWKGMRQRCNSPNNKSYKDYGGRGILICNEWADFKSFYDWAMSNGYADNLTIERIDNNGNYEPNNCRWIPNEEQSKNRRFTTLTLNGETHTIKEWTKIVGVSDSTIRFRLKQNLPIEKVLAPGERCSNEQIPK
jgi:hypothetical protein